MINSIKEKLLKIIDNDLNEILENQTNPSQGSKHNPVFDNFDEDFKVSLDKNRKFIKSIKKSIQNTKK